MSKKLIKIFKIWNWSKSTKYDAWSALNYVQILHHELLSPKYITYWPYHLTVQLFIYIPDHGIFNRTWG